MTITLTRGTESVTISGDDDLIVQSASYQGTWERAVNKVITAFYADKPDAPKEDA